MNNTILRIVFVWLLWLSSNQITAASAESPLVRSELLADVKAIRPGKAFQLGVLLKIKPQWHVYWINAGDAGLPTEVQISVPKGYKVGPLQYPLPIRFTQPGDIVGYGYSDEVLFIAKVQSPEDLAVGVKVPVNAEVSWLVCKDQCIAGSAKLVLTLPVVRDADYDTPQLFQDWVKQLPLDPNAPQSPRVDVMGKLPAGDVSSAFIVQLQWKQTPKKVECYPTALEGLRVEDIQLQSKKRQTQITFTAQKLQGYKLKAKHLKLLAVATQADGKRIGVWIKVPL